MRKKMVFDIFDFLHSHPSGPNLYFKRLIRLLQLFIVKHSDGTIICSEKRVEQLGDVRPFKLEVIHNAPIIFDHEYDFSENRVKIIYVGILQNHRLLEELLDVVSSRNDCELNIAGFGKLEQLVKNYSMKFENIIFHGKTLYNQTIALEKSSDLMVALYDPAIDNHIYAAPNKFYEALMLGKPLIMVKETGFSEIIEEYDFGVTIEYSKVSLESGIDYLIDKRHQWHSMSNGMKKFFKDNYDWRIMEERLIKFYNTL
jgi:glycosyltransferase involved in cell wall biosynthesis